MSAFLCRNKAQSYRLCIYAGHAGNAFQTFSTKNRQHQPKNHNTQKQSRRERAPGRRAQKSEKCQRPEVVPPPLPPESAQELTASFGRVGGFRPRRRGGLLLLPDAAELLVPVRPLFDLAVPVRAGYWRTVQARTEGQAWNDGME